MRHFYIIFIALFVFALPTCNTAEAQLLHFEWQGGALNNNAIDNSSWYQDSNPTPIFTSFMYFTQIAVENGVGHVTGNINGTDVNFTEDFTSVKFFQRYSDESMSGGFDDGMDGKSFGLQLYTGSETNPVFSPGFFVLDNGNLNVTAVNGVPECSTWAMMLLGFSGLGFFASKKLQHRTRLGLQASGSAM